MSFLDITFGGAVPGGWTARRAIYATINALDPGRNAALFTERIDLLDGVDTTDWPPPWQGARGTCNAFAVKAMEELRLTAKGGKPTELSAEFLYAKMRRMPKALEAMQLSPAVAARLDTTGGTFLHQAMAAINAHGIAAADKAPSYDPDLPPAAYLRSFDQQVEDDAKRRYPARIDFRHDVARSDAAGDQREWLKGDDETVSTIVATQLKGGSPVAASFAILEDAEYVWLGELAQTTGEVRYPEDSVADGRAAVAGHAVCIVGFWPDPAVRPAGGWFVFRNSLGVEEFGAEPRISPRTADLPGPGYGIISTADVDRYCWEYLSRAVSGGGLAKS